MNRKPLLFICSILYMFMSGCVAIVPKDQMVVSAERFSKYTKEEGGAWIVYGMEVRECIEPSGHIPYSCEVDSRTSAVKYWINKNPPNVPVTTMHDLEKVQQAGFMHEYVWTYLLNPNWSKPENLHEKEFDEWRKENLIGHSPEVQEFKQFK